MNRVKRAVQVSVVLAMVSAGSVLAIEPASAHIGSWGKNRAGCRWEGGVNSLDSFAYTKKVSGNCSGHSWLRVQYTNGTWSDDLHGAGGAEVYGSIRQAYHKSQSSESWGRSH